MAVGDAAAAAGYPLVPDTGSEDAKVKYGAREINRTRDLIAAVKALIPTSVSGFQTASGISYGYSSPSGGSDGNIYLKLIS